MPFSIERNDLARVSADAIVVAANEWLQIDGGVGLAVARAAGLEEMQEACNAIGGCPVGSAVATPAFALGDHGVRVVVHVVGPIWRGGGQGEDAVLRAAYDSALACAADAGACSIAMPLVSARTFGFPVRVSFVIAIEAIKEFLETHDANVHLVLYGEDAMAVGVTFFDDIVEYIDDHYVEEREASSFVSRRYDHAEKPDSRPRPLNLPRQGYRRHGGVIARLSEAADGIRERLAERRDARDRDDSAARVDKEPRASSSQAPHAPGSAESCVVRGEEADEFHGPFLTPQQYDEIAYGARAGFCPKCGSFVPEQAAFCPRCGAALRETTASAPGQADWAAPAAVPSQADRVAPVTAPEQTGEFAPIPAPTADIDELQAAQASSYERDMLEAPSEWTVAAAPDLAARGVFASAPSAKESFAPAPSAQGAPAFSGGSLADWLDRLDAPFSTTLLALIDARGFTDAEVYKRANMSRQLFSKIRSDAGYRPTKKTVLALAVALGLDLAETCDLLERAGFALSHSNKADVIVEYFIVNGNHDIFAINEALYAFDQPLL